MDDKKIEKKAKAIPDGVPILAWEFDKKDTPSIMVFTKTNGKVYIEKSAQHESGCFILDGYRKQSDTVSEFVGKIKELIHGFENISQDTDDCLCEYIDEFAKEYGVEVEECNT